MKNTIQRHLQVDKKIFFDSRHSLQKKSERNHIMKNTNRDKERSKKQLTDDEVLYLKQSLWFEKKYG